MGGSGLSVLGRLGLGWLARVLEELGLGVLGFSLRVNGFRVVGFSVGFRLRGQERYWAYSLVCLGLG